MELESTQTAKINPVFYLSTLVLSSTGCSLSGNNLNTLARLAVKPFGIFQASIR
jgi:hypothetical protein